jgi:hypothetical protein
MSSRSLAVGLESLFTGYPGSAGFSPDLTAMMAGPPGSVTAEIQPQDRLALGSPSLNESWRAMMRPPVGMKLMFSRRGDLIGRPGVAHPDERSSRDQRLFDNYPRLIAVFHARGRSAQTRRLPRRAWIAGAISVPLLSPPYHRPGRLKKFR